jgi:hypothetical protein
VQEIRFMTILPKPSVSPLPSYASLPTHRPVSFAETVMLVWRWFTGRQKPPSKSEVQLQARLVDLLAEEMANGEVKGSGQPSEINIPHENNAPTARLKRRLSRDTAANAATGEEKASQNNGPKTASAANAAPAQREERDP